MKLKPPLVLCLAAALSGACDRATTGAPIPVYERPQVALVLVDVQEDFVPPGGRPPVAERQFQTIAGATNRLVEKASPLGVDVVYVESRPSPAGGPEARPVRGKAPIFAKGRADAFSNPDLDRYFRSRSIDHLVLAGTSVDRSIYYTAEGAMNRGYKVKVVGDAVGAASDERRDRALERLQREGIEIIDSERLLAEWVRRKSYLASR